jgi:hypothetical protein
MTSQSEIHLFAFSIRRLIFSRPLLGHLEGGLVGRSRHASEDGLVVVQLLLEVVLLLLLGLKLTLVLFDLKLIKKNIGFLPYKTIVYLQLRLESEP